MASAIRWRTSPAAAPHPSEQVSLSRSAQLLGILAFSLPYLLLGWLTQPSLFLGDARAHLLGRTLVALGDLRLENIVLGYPLIPALVAALRPAPTTLMIAAALSAGATLWLLWQMLAAAPFHVLTRLVLLFACAAAPSTAFLATQSFGEMLALLLLLVAWNNFVAFARTNRTWNGFVAGLVIGLAFFVSLYALIYALAFVIFAPFYLYQRGAGTLVQQRARIVSGVVVIAFPALMGFLAWSYLSWIFTGDPFRYTRDITAPLAAFADGTPLLGLRAVLTASLYDVLRLPLYLALGLVTLVYAPRRLLTFLAPLCAIMLTRALGWAYSEPFALATLTLVALAGIPRRRRLGWLLLPAALLQIVFAFGLESRSAEQSAWRDALLTDAPTLQDQTETQIASLIAAAPAHRVLIDSSAAYRLIARVGSAEPLIDADNAAYQLAVSAPAQYVDYILVTDGDQLAQRFDREAPAGFALDRTWAGGRLYRRAFTP